MGGSGASLTPAACSALKLASGKIAEAYAERNKLIREAYALGVSLNAIAECVDGLSRAGVYEIVRPGRKPQR